LPGKMMQGFAWAHAMDDDLALAGNHTFASGNSSCGTWITRQRSSVARIHQSHAPFGDHDRHPAVSSETNIECRSHGTYQPTSGRHIERTLCLVRNGEVRFPTNDVHISVKGVHVNAQFRICIQQNDGAIFEYDSGESLVGAIRVLSSRLPEPKATDNKEP